jgi:hypothetical protein
MTVDSPPVNKVRFGSIGFTELGPCLAKTQGVCIAAPEDGRTPAGCRRPRRQQPDLSDLAFQAQ